ncbi:MAG: iron-containing alcohol dehydrogenase, partial [Deltaproteobacteria bacterium]|nr:iron-containing alcohol dehydrogenase [Deltaproteobacteria bacterium]
MNILRVNMSQLTTDIESLPEDWTLIGGRGLIAKVMNKEVSPDIDPLGPDGKLIIAAGPLAGTMAPQLGRISLGCKSPLTKGIKKANVGGPAAQKLDKLGIRGIIIEGASGGGRWYLLRISKEGTTLESADEYAGMRNYRLNEELRKRFGDKSTLITIGPAGERKYTGASIALTDVYGDPSRAAGRGGIGAVMGAKGLKAIVIDDADSGKISLADPAAFRETVRNWVGILRKDVGCGLFHTFGTPLAVSNMSMVGSMPARGNTSGRHEEFRKVSGDAIKNNVWERGGKMHGCMPGCVVQCSIIYNGPDGERLCSAFEYEAVALLGTNLDIIDLDAIARMKYLCDDIGLDLIEMGGSLVVAISGGRLQMGDAAGAIRLLEEIGEGTEFGAVLGNGAVATGKALNVERVPAFKGQAIPGHDGRAAKGVGVTYATSPMGADHNAGLTYKIPGQKKGQIENSLAFQIRAATCDTIGYCLNSVPGGQTSVYEFFSDLINARYGMNLTADNLIEIGKQTLKDENAFNNRAEFSRIWEPYPAFYRTEPLPPTNRVFDVEESEIEDIWNRIDAYKEKKKAWEIRIAHLPPMLIGAGVLAKIGGQAKGLQMTKVLFLCDPVMKQIGRADEIINALAANGIETVLFTDIEPDPPIWEIENLGELYAKKGCDGIIAMGGGSSMDAAKALSVRVTHSGHMSEYESLAGGTGKIKDILPPVICIPTTSGTGSEANTYAVLTDTERGIKFIIMSEIIVPKLAIIDPEVTKTMPKGLTAETGIDALAHCIEGYVGTLMPYHPYYATVAYYGIKLVGRSLPRVCHNPDDLEARTDMAMAAVYGGAAFTKGLGVGHNLGHVIGARYHISHGKSIAPGLLCFARVNEKACREDFKDLAWTLNRS